MNLTQANRNRAIQNLASPNPVNRILLEEASRNQAIRATAIPTAPATRPPRVTATRARVIPASANRVKAEVVNPRVRKVIRPAQKVRANPRVNRNRKIQVAIAIRCRAIRGPVTQVPVVLLRLVIPVKAKAKVKANQATRKVNLRANRKVIRIPKVNPRVAIVQATAKAIAFPGQPVIPRAVPVAIRKAVQAANQQAIPQASHHHRRVTRTIHQPANRIVQA